MELNQRPEKFSRWNDLWSEWDTWLEDNHISALKACLNFALSYKLVWILAPSEVVPDGAVCMPNICIYK